MLLVIESDVYTERNTSFLSRERGGADEAGKKLRRRR
jgi:hypothetical protein